MVGVSINFSNSLRMCQFCDVKWKSIYHVLTIFLTCIYCRKRWRVERGEQVREGVGPAYAEIKRLEKLDKKRNPVEFAAQISYFTKPRAYEASAARRIARGGRRRTNEEETEDDTSAIDRTDRIGVNDWNMDPVVNSSSGLYNGAL